MRSDQLIEAAPAARPVTGPEPAESAQPESDAQPGTALPGDVVEQPEELLIEEISIDGMCGVY
jgi:mycofactocin precursor